MTMPNHARRSAVVLSVAFAAAAFVAPRSADAESWPAEVTPLSVTAGTPKSVTGDLSSGKRLALGWASNSSVACFPATQNTAFEGKHVLYATSLPKESEMKITLTPTDPKVDLSLYAYTMGATDFTHVPANVPSVTACEASYGASAPNPGAAESVKLVSTTNAYNVVIGVAGTKGTLSGGYTLKIELTSKGTTTSATLTATAVAPTSTTSSSLDKGGVIDLAWAAQSSMACFPATENLNFTGNHVLFTTTLAKESEMTISAVPGSATQDLSLYAYTVSASSTPTLPPSITSAVSCEAGYDQKNDHNPGTTETVKLISTTNSYNVVIGVAGAGTTKTGSFKVSVSTKPR
jgi:hypothetical protein